MPRKKPYKKRRKGRRGHYHTGMHSSPKCLNSPFKYRSGWELVVANQFDQDPSVVCYEYESLKIPYVMNVRTKKMRNYIPDFLVTFTNGKKVIVEVKRHSALNQLIIQKKTAAAKAWVKINNMEYELWTDSIIKALKRIQGTRDKVQRIQTAAAKKKAPAAVKKKK